MNLDLKIIAIREVSFLEFVPRSNRSRKDAVRVEFTHYKLNTKRMKMIRSCVRGLVNLNSKDTICNVRYITRLNICHKIAIGWLGVSVYETVCTKGNNSSPSGSR